MVIHSSFRDFVLFLYVHMALIDGDIHEIEENVILQKLSRLFPSLVDANYVLKLALTQYRKVDPTTILTVIEDSVTHFEEVKRNGNKILDDMFDIINADGHVDEFELGALHTLHDLIQKIK